MSIFDLEGKYLNKEDFTIHLDFGRDVIRVPNILNRPSFNVFHDTVEFVKGNISTISIFESSFSDYILVQLQSINDGTTHRVTFTLNDGDDDSFIQNIVSSKLEKI